MQKKLLINLIKDLKKEMLKLGYSSASIGYYQLRWNKLLQFSNERGEKHFTERLGLDFLEKHFHILEKDLKSPLSPSQAQALRIIRTIGDFQLHRTILRRYCRNKKFLTDPYFISINNKFKSYCIKKSYSNRTIDDYTTLTEKFMDYLVSQRIKNCKDIDLELIHAYIKTLSGYSYKTVALNISAIRSFFRFLLEIKKVKVDFSKKMPMMQARKYTHIPSVWTKSELERLIAAIDRGSPTGKRDYAIILLACTLGMRVSDIKALKMENFHWEEKKIVFTQSKTKTPLTLPLTKEVGWAVIDYLKYGRPKIDSPNLFLRHLAPFGAYSEHNSLFNLIRKYMKLAHIPTQKKHRGMHSLRHTLASMLLEENTPISTISDILGHIDVDSTAVYLKVDIKKLKECALSFEEGETDE